MKSLLYGLLLVLFVSVSGQDLLVSADSLRKQFNKIYTTQPDSAQLIIDEFQKLATSNDFPPAAAYAAYLQAKLASRTISVQEGIGLYKKAQQEHEDLLSQEMPEAWKKALWTIAARRDMDAGVAYLSVGEFQKGLEEFRRLLAASLQASDSSLYGHAMGRMGAAHFYLGEEDSAAFYIEQQKAIGIAIRDISHISVALGNLSIIYRGKGEFAKALASLQAGKDELNQLEESPLKDKAIASLNSALGSLFYMRDDYEQAREMYQAAYDFYQGKKDTKSINLLYEMGDVYKSLDLYDSAAHFYRSSLQLARELKQEVDVIYIHSRLSDLYFEMQAYDVSEAYVDSGLTGQKIKQLAFEGFFLNKSKAELLLERSNANQALTYAVKAEQWSDSLDVNLEYDKEINDLLYRIHKQRGDLRMALRHHEKFKALNDSLRSEAQTQEFTIVDQEHKAEKEKLALLAEQQRTELALNNKLQRQRVIQYSAFAGFGLVGLLALSFYRSYKTKQKDNARMQEQASQLAQKNDQLEELSNFKEGLTQMIAHDMKNSLNVILGLSENDQKDKMKHIHQAGGQLLSMVLNMLDIQKFEATQIQLNPKAHEIGKLIGEAVPQVELLAHSEGLTIDRELSDTPMALCNENLVIRVLVNLLNNAIKYAQGKSSIIIKTASTEDGLLQVSVVDFGAGIHEEDLTHVFDKFWQTNARNSGKVSSTGLGLTFCKLAIEAHGGHIWADSKPGEGSTFSFTLPTVVPETAQVTHNNNLIMEEERKLVLQLSSALRSLQVYQAGEIFKVLNQEEVQNLQSPWVQEIKAAVEQSDTNKFRTLVEI